MSYVPLTYYCDGDDDDDNDDDVKFKSIVAALAQA